MEDERQNSNDLTKYEQKNIKSQVGGVEGEEVERKTQV